MPYYVIVTGAVATLGIYSILYRENPVFRFFEHVFIGVAAGYGFQLIITDVLDPDWWTPMVHEGRWWWILALLVGSLFYLIYSRRLVWMSRLLMVGLMALTAGSTFKGFVTLYVPQMVASFKPIVVSQAPYLAPTNLLIFVTLVTVMSYFFFSFEHRHALIRGSARTGRWMLMVTFGAIFGSTVMGRMSLFIDRAAFLLFDFLRISPR
jgi:hypothetical protein